MIGRVTADMDCITIVEKGYFFIRVPTQPDRVVDYFAHRRDLRGVRIFEIEPDMLLQFLPTESDKGPRALEIRPAPDGAVEGPEPKHDTAPASPRS